MLLPTDTSVNLNITTAGDQNNKIGRDLKQRIKVKDGGKVWLGSESVNVLQILSDLIQVVADIANTTSSHTHPYTDNGSPMNTQAPNQSGAFSGQKSSANGLTGQLDPVIDV